MKVIMEKQTPITPAQTDGVNNDVMNLLTGMLFASFYVQTNQDATQPPPEPTLNETPNTTVTDQAGSSSSQATTQAVLTDGLAPATTILLNQLIQAANQEKEAQASNDNPRTTQALDHTTPVNSANPTLNQDSIQLTQSLNTAKVTTKEEDKQIPAFVTNVENDTTLSETMSKVQTFVKPAQDKHEFKQPLPPQESAQTPATAPNKTPDLMLSNPVNNQITNAVHRLQKPLQAWVADMNQTKSMRDIPTPLQNNVTVGMRPESSIEGFSRAPTDTSVLNAAKPETPITFHFDKLEPVAGQHNVYEMNIHVSPAELGPVQAKLKLNKNKVEIVILTNNSQAEQAIKLHLPQLTEKFQQSSLQISVSVQQQSTLSYDQGSSHSSSQTQHYQQDDSLPASTAKPEPNEKKQKNADALIDTYI